MDSLEEIFQLSLEHFEISDMSESFRRGRYKTGGGGVKTPKRNESIRA